MKLRELCEIIQGGAITVSCFNGSEFMTEKFGGGGFGCQDFHAAGRAACEVYGDRDVTGFHPAGVNEWNVGVKPGPVESPRAKYGDMRGLLSARRVTVCTGDPKASPEYAVTRGCHPEYAVARSCHDFADREIKSMWPEDSGSVAVILK